LRMSILATMTELSVGFQVHDTSGYLCLCSLDNDRVCCDTINETDHRDWIDLERERIWTNKCSFGSLRLLGVRNVEQNLHERSLFFCQIRNRVFLKRCFFEGSGQGTKIELVSGDQMALPQ